MIKISKKQRKALRAVWRLGKPRKAVEHVRRINVAMERGARRVRTSHLA